MLKHSHHEPNPDDGFELQDVSVKVILASGIFMVVFTLGCYFVSFMFTKMMTAEGRQPISNYEAPPMAADHNEWTTGTRLQPKPGTALKQHKDGEFTVSNSWGTVSESPEIYRVPINDALNHVAKTGLPVWEPQKAQTQE